jgi:hypothetical protein
VGCGALREQEDDVNSGFGDRFNIPGLKPGSIAFGNVCTNPFADSIEPCENCGSSVTALSVSGVDADIPVRFYEVELVGRSEANLTLHSPARCRGARRNIRDDGEQQ